jgi:hypothetical protein
LLELGMPAYLRNALDEMDDYEAWAALHRDRYLAPEHAIKLLQQTSPLLLSMLRAKMEVVDNLSYPDSFVVSSECEHYIHRLMTKNYPQRPISNARHAEFSRRCQRTLNDEERTLLARYTDRKDPLGKLLQELDDTEMERSYNMQMIIVSTCAAEQVNNNTKKARALTMPPPPAAAAAAAAEEEAAETATRDELIDSLVRLLQEGEPSDQVPDKLHRLYDRTRTLLYEYYALRLRELSERAWRRRDVLLKDVHQQVRYSGSKLARDMSAEELRVAKAETYVSNAAVELMVGELMSDLERMLCDRRAMSVYLPAAAAAAAGGGAVPLQLDNSSSAKSEKQRIRDTLLASGQFAPHEIRLPESESEASTSVPPTKRRAGGFMQRGNGGSATDGTMSTPVGSSSSASESDELPRKKTAAPAVIDDDYARIPLPPRRRTPFGGAFAINSALRPLTNKAALHNSTSNLDADDEMD